MKWFLRRAALLTATVALAVAAVGTAGAQVTKPMTVAVLKFSNSSGVRGDLLAKSASAATETQFIGSTRYDVVKKDTVDKTMTDLTLSYPLDRLGMQQLATALEADGIVTGDVLRVLKNPKTGQWSVTLKVEMTDRSSGELVNGAIVTGDSGTRPDFSGSEDLLVDEAINKAAFAAVRSMNERILPEGTVFATSSHEGQSETLLNIGSNSGVRQGMEFIVLRNREQVGRIKVTSVSPTDANAAVISTTRGVQPEDKIRAVFRLEDISADSGGTGASTATVHRPKMNLSNFALGAGLLVGLWKLNSGNLSGGGTGVRNVSISASGPFNGAPESDVMPEVPVVHLKFSPPVGVKESDVLAYFIYKDSEVGKPQDLVGSGGRDSYIDAYAINADFKVVGATTPLDVTGSHADGPDIGRPLRFLIRTPYNKTTTSTTTGSTTTTTTVALAQDVYTGLVTFLIPPLAISASATDVTKVTFSFKVSPGADHFVVQVADNLGFTNSEFFPNAQGLAVPPVPGIGPLQWFADPATAVVTENTTFEGNWVNTSNTDYVQTLTANLLTGAIDPTIPSKVLYWRAGVRDSRDASLPENGGWVFGTAMALGQATPALTQKAVHRGPTGGPVRPRGNTTPATPDPASNAGTVGRGGRG